REFLERPEAALENVAHHVGGLAGVLVGKQFAVGGEDVDALPRGAASAFAWALVGDGAEELALGVVAAALIPVVGADGDEILCGPPDDLGVGEGERTARDPVVSGTAERVPVHLPQEDGLALLRGQLAGAPQVGQPGDGGPRLLGLARFDDLAEFVEVL